MASTSHPRSTRRSPRLASWATLPLALSAFLGSAVALASPTAAATHTVEIRQYAYSPASLTVDAGDTVTWTNQDSVAHDVTVTQGPASFHSPMLGQGQSWSHTFTVAGRYSYICSVHPDMEASVTVDPVATPTPRKTSSRHPAPVAAPTASAPATGTGGRHVTASSSAPKASAATQVAAPSASQDVTTPVRQAGSTLSPLLLVAGASTAVMVFCLLLLTSRPAVREAEPDPEA
jgi:plastocyanin